jgi:hypothetical protein
MSGYGLCLDKDEENPIKVFVDQAKVPTRCKGNTSYEYRLLYLQRGVKIVIESINNLKLVLILNF